MRQNFFTGGTKNICIAKLDNGEEVEYDACSKNRNAYNPEIFEYIGQGVIWTVNGKNQNMEEIMHFFKRKQ